MGTILIILLVLLLLGALPTWPYSGSWGYYPSGGLGLILLIVVILALTGNRFSRSAVGAGYLWLSLECVSIRRLVMSTSARIWVHSERTLPTTCPHFDSGSACM